jgi:hypothetical protein
LENTEGEVASYRGLYQSNIRAAPDHQINHRDLAFAGALFGGELDPLDFSHANIPAKMGRLIVRKIIYIAEGTFFLVIMLLSLAITFVIFPSLKSEVAAAWVQAVGSIGAIAGTWWATNYHWTKSEKVRIAESTKTTANLAESCLVIATDTDKIVSHIRWKFQSGAMEISTERLEEVQWLLRQMLSRSIHPRLFADMLPLQRELAYTLSAVRQHNLSKVRASEERVKKALHREQTVTEAKDRVAVTSAKFQTDAGRAVQ